MLRDLSSRIYTDFTYRSGSTTVSTQVSEVLAAREGVCQDFARLAIACLRANGLAASYVSGYLATDPPPGKERMVGIDATHAWASVWTPQNQWLGLDPTNDQMVDERYITVGFGRDYADVPPLRGIIYTDSESSVIDVVGRRRAVRGWRAACVTSHCPNCGQRLAFENSLCLSCGSSLGFSLEDMALLVIAPGEESEHAGAVDSEPLSVVRESVSAPSAIGWSRRRRHDDCARRAR